LILEKPEVPRWCGALSAKLNCEIMELTSREEKIAKRCAAKQDSFIIRNGKIIVWVGVVLFTLGILPLIPLPQWIKTLFLDIGMFMIIYGIFSDFIIIIGKLYNRSKEIQSKRKT